MSPLQATLFYLNVAATAALVFRLFSSGLYSIYPCFSSYLSFDLLKSVVYAALPFESKVYGDVYRIGQSVKLLLGIFVVLELYRLALAGHPALARFGRRTVGYVLAAAAAAAACGIILDSSVPSGQSPLLHRFFSFERTMDAWLLIFLLLICLFMTWFPVRLTRNVALYIVGFLIYSLARSSGLFLLNVLPLHFTFPLTIAMRGASLACLVAWSLALRREGEQTTMLVGHRWNPAAMGRLSDQLDSINSSLARLSQ